jgi:hypothetical protein
MFNRFNYNIPASNGFYYKLTQVTSTAVTEFKDQEDLRNQIAALEKEFAQAYQDTRSYNQKYIKISYDNRLAKLRNQLDA